MAYHGHTGYTGWAHGGDGYHESYPSFHWRQDSASSRGWEESRTLLWVSCIPRTMRAAELGQVFQRFGPLVRVEIPAPKENGHKWVFGYVQFEQPQDAAIAIQRMHGAYIGSHSKTPLVVEYSINTSYLQSAEERRPQNASRGFAARSRRREDREESVNDPRARGRGRGRSRSREPTDNYDYDYDYHRERSSKPSLIHPDRQQRFRSRSRSPKARGPRRSRSSSSSPRWGDRISATPSPSRGYQQRQQQQQQQQQRDSSQEALDRLRWTPSPVRGGSGERVGRGRREDTGRSEGEIHEERAQQQQQQQQQQPARRSRWDEREQDWEERRQREGNSMASSMNDGKRPKQQQKARAQRRRPIDSPEPATGITIRGSSSAGESSGRAGSSKRQKRFKREQGEGDGRCRL